jgi:AcrR family transcriptional regulator
MNAIAAETMAITNIPPAAKVSNGLCRYDREARERKSALIDMGRSWTLGLQGDATVNIVCFPCQHGPKDVHHLAMPKVKTIARKSAKKSAYHHGNLRHALLDSALALMAEGKAHELTLRSVARRAGVTHAAPYRHFPDKGALLTAVAQEGFVALATQMKARMASYDSPLERLNQSGVAYVLFALGHENHYRVMFGPRERGGAEFEAMQLKAGDAMGVLLGAILAAQNSGAVRSGDPMKVAHACWGLTHGLAMGLIDGTFEPFGITRKEAERFTLETLGTLMNGLAPR